MSPELKSLRLWLMTTPRPAALNIIDHEEQPHRIETKGTKWIEIAKTVLGLEPKKIEALDAKGHTLRATRTDDMPEVPEERVIEERASAERGAGQNELDFLVVFARLIADAYKHSTTIAFDKLVALFDSNTKRTESLQKIVESVLKKRAAAVLDDDDGDSGGTFEQELMKGLLEGRMKGELEKAAMAAVAKTKPNGSPEGGSP